MASLTLTLPDGELAVTGKQITFEAPCGSNNVTDVIIGGKSYALVDTAGKAIHKNAFVQGAIVAIILNVESKKAFVQDSAHSYVDAYFYKKTQVDAKFYSKTQIDDMLGSYVNDIANLLGGEANADS